MAFRKEWRCCVSPKEILPRHRRHALALGRLNDCGMAGEACAGSHLRKRDNHHLVHRKTGPFWKGAAEHNETRSECPAETDIRLNDPSRPAFLATSRTDGRHSPPEPERWAVGHHVLWPKRRAWRDKIPKCVFFAPESQPEFPIGPTERLRAGRLARNCHPDPPSILLHLSAQKAQPIRPFFPNDFRSCYVVAVVE